MSSFFPDDIAAESAISPRQIMEQAGEELGRLTKILAVSIDENVLSDRIVLAFRIINASYSMDFNLFEASHRLDETYPVLIDPPASDIPEFLRRERYVAGAGNFSDLAASLGSLTGRSGRVIKNEWVSATPAEFTEKLKKLFALDHVKSRILTLQAPALGRPRKDQPEDTSEEPSEEKNEG